MKNEPSTSNIYPKCETNTFIKASAYVIFLMIQNDASKFCVLKSFIQYLSGKILFLIFCTNSQQNRVNQKAKVFLNEFVL